MPIESRPGSRIDAEKEQKRVESGGVDENAEQLLTNARAMGFDTVEEFQAWLNSRPNADKFGTDKDNLNEKHRTQVTSKSSGTKFNTSNWGADWAGAKMIGKERRKNK